MNEEARKAEKAPFTLPKFNPVPVGGRNFWKNRECPSVFLTSNRVSARVSPLQEIKGRGREADAY
jgi:hypothetical protein